MTPRHFYIIHDDTETSWPFVRCRSRPYSNTACISGTVQRPLCGSSFERGVGAVRSSSGCLHSAAPCRSYLRVRRSHHQVHRGQQSQHPPGSGGPLKCPLVQLDSISLSGVGKPAALQNQQLCRTRGLAAIGAGGQQVLAAPSPHRQLSLSPSLSLSLSPGLTPPPHAAV